VSCACQDSGGKAYLEAVHQVLAANPKFKEVAPGEATNDTIRIRIVSSAIMPKSARELPKTGLTVTCEKNGTPVLSQDIETCSNYPISMFVKNMLAELPGI
jgi:hypothetical protein